MKKIYTSFLLVLLMASNAFAEPETPKEQVKITRSYPNPATSMVNFEFTQKLDKGYSIQIYSFIGNKVTEVAVNAYKISIPLDNFFRGLYLYRLVDKTGKVIDSGKFQVVK
jgi:ABC-type metal ion transport system substrate-binding protein